MLGPSHNSSLMSSSSVPSSLVVVTSDIVDGGEVLVEDGTDGSESGAPAGATAVVASVEAVSGASSTGETGVSAGKSPGERKVPPPPTCPGAAPTAVPATSRRARQAYGKADPRE